MGSALLEIIVMLIVSAGLGFVIAWFIQKSKLDKLQALFDQKVIDYNDLDQSYNELDSRFKDLQKKNKSLEADLSKYRAEIADLKSKIENLQTDLTKNKDEIIDWVAGNLTRCADKESDVCIILSLSVAVNRTGLNPVGGISGRRNS